MLHVRWVCATHRVNGCWTGRTHTEVTPHSVLRNHGNDSHIWEYISLYININITTNCNRRGRPVKYLITTSARYSSLCLEHYVCVWTEKRCHLNAQVTRHFFEKWMKNDLKIIFCKYFSQPQNSIFSISVILLSHKSCWFMHSPKIHWDLITVYVWHTWLIDTDA